MLAVPMLVLSVPEVFSRQVIERAELSHVQVEISMLEQNRLSIQGRRIAHVVPSRKDALTVLKDEGLGVLYFALSEEEQTKQTVTLFVTDDTGVNYKLILVPKKIAGEEIVLVPPRERSGTSTDFVRTHLTASYQRKIKNLTLLMANPLGERRGDIEELNRTVGLWREVELRLLSKLAAGDMVGEHYRMINTSPSPMRLAEQELYRPGILSIAIEHHALASGDSTDIFLVRQRVDDE